ncbi:MAG: hypothetical protein DDT27_00631 [Dehalococcoidia bacterium]|nr:hypothetical protein [Bacillota bacterium]MBT9162087.1 hypothetical protein [Chloroflexota bacterium]
MGHPFKIPLTLVCYPERVKVFEVNKSRAVAAGLVLATLARLFACALVQYRSDQLFLDLSSE